MFRIKTPDKDTLVVESYPLFLVGLVGLLGITIFVLWLRGIAVLDITGWLIVCGVLGVFVVIHKYRETVVKKGAAVSLSVLGITGQHETGVPVSAIDRFDMMYGRGGGYARGGTLVFYTTDGEKHVVIDTDINPGSAKKIADAKSRIAAFLADG